MIWVLTAGFGDGHNTAARSVAEALRLQAPAERVEVCDLIAEAQPLLSGFTQWAYRAIIVTVPSVWRMVYEGFAKPGMCQNARWFRPLVKALEARLRSDPPEMIVSTFPLYSSLIADLRNQGVKVPPIITVITDSITVHPSWVAAPSDLLCVPDEETRQSVLEFGVDLSTVQITGFPVSLAFQRSKSEGPRQPGPARVLYMPSTSTGWVRATLEALLPVLKQGIHMTLLTGRHSSRLYHVVRSFTDKHPRLNIEVVGWTNQVPQMLCSHDILISKAGGAILHEALAAQIPAIIDYVVPGQEEGNAELLLNHGCGLLAKSPVETAAHLSQMVDNNLALARKMRDAMRPLSAPEAAGRVANLALARTR